MKLKLADGLPVGVLSEHLNGHLLDASMGQTATCPQLTGVLLGTSKTERNSEATTFSASTSRQPSYARLTPPTKSPGSALSLAQPAITQVTQPLPSSSFGSNNSFESCDSGDSVQSWLEKTLQSTSSLATTQISQELGKQFNCRKRKRGASVELARTRLAVPLTRKALKRHQAATMSSAQSSLGNVYAFDAVLGYNLLTFIA